MLSLTTEDIEQLTKPLCSKEIFEKKIHNFNKVKRSFKSRDEYCEGLPIELNLEPSGFCNLNCPGCPRGRNRIKRTGFLSYRVFRDVFTQVGETLCNVFISGFGEPLMNDELPRMIQLASQYSVSTIMNTNGTLLAKHVEALLDTRLTLINIALDGIMTDSYHQYNPGAQFESVIKGVKQLCRRKTQRGLKYPVIEGQILIREDTFREINRLKTWAEGIGIEKVKFKRPYLSIPGDEERPVVESVFKYKKFIEQNNLTLTEKTGWTPADCTKPWDNMLLSCTGYIGICCYDPHLRLKLNELAEPIDIVKMWNGEAIRKVRRWLSGHGTKTVNPCSRCNRMPGYLIPQ